LICLVDENITSVQDVQDVIALEMTGRLGQIVFFGLDLEAALRVIHGANPSLRILASKWQLDDADLIAVVI